MRIEKLNGRFLIGRQELGQGAFATVYPGRDLQTNKIVAIKKINAVKHRDILERIDQEIGVHISLESQHIVRLVDSFMEKQSLYIVTELCEFGDLENFTSRFPNSILPEDVARMFSFQILLAFITLVDMKLIHRDMKLQNIFLNKDFECKVADFGFAKSKLDVGQSIAGSPITMAPEVLCGNHYDEKQDIWSFGCIVYAMVHGRYPFVPARNGGIQELEELVLKCELVFDNPNVSKECENFIRKLLRVEPKQRITWDKMFEEPWFATCNETTNKEVIKKHLLKQKPIGLHVNDKFALQFGYYLGKFVEQKASDISKEIQALYASADQANLKDIGYLLTLLVARLSKTEIEFVHKGQSHLLQPHHSMVERMKEAVGYDNYKVAVEIIEKSQVSLEQIIQSLTTQTLNIIKVKDSSQHMLPIAVRIIDLLVGTQFFGMIKIEMNEDRSKGNLTDDDVVENINLNEAFQNCEISLIQDYFPELLDESQSKIQFNSIQKQKIHDSNRLVLLRNLLLYECN